MKIRRQEFIKFDRQFPIYNFFFPSQGTLVKEVNWQTIYKGQSQIKSRALYFHIPFCETICSFCPFTRGKYSSESQIEDYVNALIAELEIKSKLIDLKTVPIGAIFFGGGTPSLMTADQIRKVGQVIHDKFDLSKIKEFSFEIEVKSITNEKVLALKSIGVTHPRFGLQTFSQKWRNIFQLTATLQQIKDAVALLVPNFPYQSFDILYGMNGQDEQELAADLEQAVALGTSNIDIYPIDNVMTQVSLHKKIDKYGHEHMSATRKFSMNIFADQMMRHSGFMPHNGHGYVRTEGEPSVVTNKYSFIYHESVYGYHTHDLMGFGTNAVSSTLGHVVTNERNRDKYISKIESGSIPCVVSTHDTSLDYARAIILRLPYHGVIEKDKLELGRIPNSILKKLQLLIKEKLVEDNEKHYNLTKLGWYWYVNIMYFLMPDSDKSVINNILHHRMKNPHRNIQRKELVY